MTEAIKPKMVEVSGADGEVWTEVMTEAEYREWCKYDDSHPHLHRIPYHGVLRMFLTNYRMGHNPNNPLNK